MTDARIRVGEVGLRHESLLPHAICFTALPALFDAPPLDAVILHGSLEETRDWLRQLRSHPAYRLLPVFSDHSADPLIQALSDGPAPGSLSLIESHCRLWRERFAVFNNGRAPEGLEALVLAYLWLRTPGRLAVSRDAGNPQIYHYPLVQCLGGTSVNDQALVRNLAQQNLLDSVDLVDRIRLCRRCGCGHLNYVDVCVECTSLDINRQPSLHCFTCGHIGRQTQFLKDGVLVCPNCLTRLRHIGSDYDRPLENYNCNDCQAFFIDADVEARCLDCGERHTPDELQVREIRHYQLSETGMLTARQGLERNIEQFFGGLAMVGSGTFKTLLDWQLELLARHRAPTFALLGMRFSNLAITLDRLGPQKGHALLDTLIEHIQVAIRDTDRCTRTSEEQLWVLLMHTDSAGLQRVTERLNRIGELFVGQDLQDIRLHTTGCVAPDGLLEKETAELLMARLAGELG